jgi:DNA-binding transcriptional ArsR family regulator
MRVDVALRALADPRRRQILALVHDRELPAGEIAGRFDVTRPAISQHLTVLREAGLVIERRQGTRRLYRARLAGAAELRQWLESFWDEGLARMQAAAEAEERNGRTDDDH